MTIALHRIHPQSTVGNRISPESSTSKSKLISYFRFALKNLENVTKCHNFFNTNFRKDSKEPQDSIHAYLLVPFPLQMQVWLDQVFLFPRFLSQNSNFVELSSTGAKVAVASSGCLLPLFINKFVTCFYESWI